MRYDDEKIKMLVNDKQKSFIQKAAFLTLLMLTALILCLVNFNDYVTVGCVLVLILLIFRVKKVIRSYNPKVLFCREITGKNRKEYEYAIQSDNRVRAFTKSNVPNTFANRKSAALRLNGTVYLELDDGSITSISGLYKSHMDIYEEGDTLIRYAGTKFPIVLDREVKKQPCPICGEVNDCSRDECGGCGLGIVRERI